MSQEVAMGEEQDCYATVHHLNVCSYCKSPRRYYEEERDGEILCLIILNCI